MKKSIVAGAVVVGLAGTATAGQFLAQKKYDDLTQAYREQVSEASGINLDIEILEQNFIKRSEKVVVRFDESLSAELGLQEDFELVVYNHATFLPFIVKGKTEIDQQQIAIKSLLATWGLESVPFESNWRANGFTQTLTSSLKVDAFNITQEDATIHVKPMTGMSTGSIDLQELNAEIIWNGLTVESADGALEIGDIKVVEQLTYQKGIWTIPMIKMNVSSIRFEQNELNNFAVEGLTLVSLVSEKDDEMKVGFSADIQQLQFEEMGSKGKLSNFSVATDIQGISAELYRQLTELGQQADPDPILAQQLGMELFGNGLNWALEKAQADLEYSDGHQQIAGSFSVNGGVELDQVDLSSLQVPQQILAYLKGELQIIATSSMVDQLPIAQQVQMFRQQGMIEQVGDKDLVKLTLKDGSLEMNGYPLM